MNPFGILNQQPNPWDDPFKMDPSKVPLGLLSQGLMQPQMAQQDMPAPGAQPAGPAQLPQTPPQQPSWSPQNDLSQLGPGMQQGGAQQAPQAQGGGFFDKLGTVASGLYGQGGPGDALITLGAGLASRDGWGKGLMQANAQMQAQAAQRQKAQGVNETAKLLSTRMGIPYEQAMGLIQSPAGASLLQSAFTSPEQFKTEKDADGNLVQVNTKTGQRTVLRAAERVQPQLVDVPGPDGTTQKGWALPGSAAVTPIGTPPAPGGVDQETLRKERAKAVVKQEESVQTKKEAAQTVIPQLDRAEKAYARLAELKAIGPLDSSATSRFIGGVFGTQAEIARQDFEAAAKELELMKAQISMKGQGQITESERRILQLTLPRLDAADPSTGLQTLRMMRQQFTKALGDNAAPTQQTGVGSPAGMPVRRRFNAATGGLE